MELQKHSVDPPGVTYTYLLPFGENSFLVAASWGHDFDAWASLFEDPKMGQHWFNLHVRTYPIVGKLLLNGVNGSYSDGALLNIEDPDDRERKWVVSTVVGNLPVQSVENLEKIMLSERMMQAYQVVLFSSFAAADEVTTRSLPKSAMWGMYGRALVQAQQESVSLAAVWIPRLTSLFSVLGRPS